MQMPLPLLLRIRRRSLHRLNQKLHQHSLREHSVYVPCPIGAHCVVMGLSANVWITYTEFLENVTVTVTHTGRVCIHLCESSLVVVPFPCAVSRSSVRMMPEKPSWSTLVSAVATGNGLPGNLCLPILLPLVPSM